LIGKTARPPCQLLVSLPHTQKGAETRSVSAPFFAMSFRLSVPYASGPRPMRRPWRTAGSWLRTWQRPRLRYGWTPPFRCRPWYRRRHYRCGCAASSSHRPPPRPSGSSPHRQGSVPSDPRSARRRPCEPPRWRSCCSS